MYAPGALAINKIPPDIADMADSSSLGMRLDRLRVSNFRALDDVDIVFPNGVIGVLGPNGSGKSSILWSITAAVAGVDGLPYKKDALVGQREDDTQIELLFSAGGVSYRVERKIRRKDLNTNAALYAADGTELARGTKAVSAEMTRLLGSLAEWQVSRFVAQKQLNALSALDSAPRKRLILRLLGIEAVEGAAARLREQSLELDRVVKSRRAALPRADEIGIEVKTAKSDIARLSREIEATRVAITGAEKTATADAVALEALELLAAELAVAREALRGHLQIESERDESCERIRSRISAGETADTELAEMETRISSAEGARSELHELDQTASIVARTGELEARLATTTTRIAEAEAAMTTASTDEQRLAELKVRLSEIEAALPATRATREAAATERGELRARLHAAREAQERAQKTMAAFESGDVRNCPVCRQPVSDPEHLRAELGDALREAEAQISQVTSTGLAARSREEQSDAALSALAEEETRLRGEAERLADAGTRLAYARSSLVEARSDEKSAVKDLELARTTPYDAERHAEVRALVDGLADLISLRGALRQRVEEARSATSELVEAEARLAESRAAREEIEARLVASGYDEEVHQRRRDESTASAEHLRSLGDRLRELEGELRTTERMLERDERALAEHAALLAEIERSLAERGSIEATKQAMEGFKINLIGTIRPALERRASVLLRELSDGRYADLSLDEDYEISIGSGGIKRSIRDISGGEEDLANLCLRIAISQLINESAGAGTTFIVLDEVLGSQDEDRQERIMELLPRLASHFVQVLMVAHLPAVQDRFATSLRGQWDPISQTSRFYWPPRAEENAGESVPAKPIKAATRTVETTGEPGPLPVAVESEVAAPTVRRRRTGAKPAEPIAA